MYALCSWLQTRFVSSQWPADFSRISSTALRRLSPLTDLRELGIDHLNISEFILGLQRYSGHFLPTLQPLALGEPKGSRRQIIYLIRLFQHLEDLKLLFFSGREPNLQEEPVDDPMLTHYSTPPLRGPPTTRLPEEARPPEDMICLFGGFRFQYMDLISVEGMWFLLDAWGGTLETLRLYQTGG